MSIAGKADAYPKEFAQCGVIWLAWLALDVFLPGISP